MLVLLEPRVARTTARGGGEAAAAWRAFVAGALPPLVAQSHRQQLGEVCRDGVEYKDWHP